MVSSTMARPQNPPIGTRFFRHDAPYIVWEVVAQYAGVDGLPHIVLRNLSDRTWQKTLSLIELERGGQYTRVPEGSQLT
jgi:hypothetical protein